MRAVLPMGGGYREAAAIDSVHYHVQYPQLGTVENLLYHRQRVVLEVLVADGVVRVKTQHRWQVALLKVPYTLGRQHPLDLPGELERVLQVVEHRDGGHHSSKLG